MNMKILWHLLEHPELPLLDELLTVSSFSIFCRGAKQKKPTSFLQFLSMWEGHRLRVRLKGTVTFAKFFFSNYKVRKQPHWPHSLAFSVSLRV